jgi:formimidoylglutamate deiminase
MNQSSVWLADLIYTGGTFEKEQALICSDSGRVTSISQPVKPENVVRLKNRVMLPGLVNTHSHAFQRVIRGRTEHRANNAKESFWTWREMMYSAANRLTPDDLYDASRMAFLEMALSGITTVGEFHYLHHAPDGNPFDDPNLLGRQVVRAALDVGLRIALLRVAYARSGYGTDYNPEQRRFLETDPELYLRRAEDLRSNLEGNCTNAWLGLAPHSIRAVPIEYLRQILDFADEKELPVHMHIAEQPAEVSACIEEYQQSPVALLQNENLLNERFTAVHAIHLTHSEVAALAQAKAKVCACPTTERNLGDGVFPADAFFTMGVTVALGSDSQIQVDLLEDARELEYNLRLQRIERVVLAPENGGSQALAKRLFTCATLSGAQSLGANAGDLTPERFADFFTLSTDDPSIAGAGSEDLLTAIVFSQNRTAVKEVVIGGKLIVKEGRHQDQDEIVEKFKALQRRLWA